MAWDFTDVPVHSISVPGISLLIHAGVLVTIDKPIILARILELPVRDWNKVYVSFILKKGKKDDAENYGLVSLI